jgi:hypothetical protein
MLYFTNMRSRALGRCSGTWAAAARSVVGVRAVVSTPPASSAWSRRWRPAAGFSAYRPRDFILDRWAPLAYTREMVERLITVAETAVFVRQAKTVWTDDEHDEFVHYIAANPEAGDVIPETGGVRKVRWKRTGSGKRGGVRVIYYFHDRERPLYLLMVYAKSRRDDLDADDRKGVRELAAAIKGKSKA